MISRFFERFAAALARAPGTRIAEIVGASLGPEMAPAANSGGYSITLSGGAAGTVTQDANGIHFAAANNIASVFKQAGGLVLEDNATYEVTLTVANFASASGGVRVLLGGATTNHGATGTTRTADGTYTERLTLVNTFSSTNIIRIQVTGTNGNNTLDVTSISVRKVL